MHITQEFMHDLAENVQRPELPDTGEISKTMALRYLAPEILQLRLLGFKLDAIRTLLEEEHLQVSLPLMLKTLRPSSLLVESIDE
ncbi:hypothetical protein [Propionivibrio sp.]|uniref:hypothetical protein n=1 Tax=Propionivibrio sp. TaxID=2212460 RepID=UPI0039E5286E